MMGGSVHNCTLPPIYVREISFDGMKIYDSLQFCIAIICEKH